MRRGTKAQTSAQAIAQKYLASVKQSGSVFGSTFWWQALSNFFPLPSGSRFGGKFSMTANYLKTPMLIISSTYDPVTGLVEGLAVNNRMATNSRLVEQKGSGHCSNAQYSSCTARYVRPPSARILMKRTPDGLARSETTGSTAPCRNPSTSTATSTRRTRSSRSRATSSWPRRRPSRTTTTTSSCKRPGRPSPTSSCSLGREAGDCALWSRCSTFLLRYGIFGSCIFQSGRPPVDGPEARKAMSTRSQTRADASSGSRNHFLGPGPGRAPARLQPGGSPCAFESGHARPPRPAALTAGAPERAGPVGNVVRKKGSLCTVIGTRGAS